MIEPTVKTAFVALAVLIIGLFLSRRVARWVIRDGLGRAGVEKGLAATIEKVVYYVLLTLVAFTALHIVNVPLTAFAMFGGVFAVALGFGARSIVNNFISGLILMIERPIRIGDIIEVDGQQGRVVNIGPRCSHVRLLDGVDLLIPNSTLLENKVINHTLSNTGFRFAIKVIVSNGADVREAARLLLMAVEEQSAILTSPKPQVVLSEFGEKTIVLEALFWMDADTSGDGRVVCSDIRFRIEELFRAAGIWTASSSPDKPGNGDPSPDPAPHSDGDM